MRFLLRLPAPTFWAEKEAAWLGHIAAGKKTSVDPLSWSYDAVTLRQHFHALVREGPRTCAYCDGDLGVTSPEVVDHFEPKKLRPELQLAWSNLFPACTSCNTAKGDQWDAALLRPDTDAVDGWVECDPESGEVRPALELDSATDARVRATIGILALNRPGLCRARRDAVRILSRGVDVPLFLFLPRPAPDS